MQQANAMEIAIEEVKKMRDEYKQRGDNGPDLWHHYIEINCLEELIDRLESLKDDHLPQDDGWISVKDRLPDKWGYYIIFPNKYYSTAEWRNGKWIYNDENGYDQEAYVSHWRLLPPEFLPPTNL